MRFLVFFFALLTVSSSYKFLVYNPLFGHSHATFIGKIADVLFDAGHQVTVLMPVFDETLENKTYVRSGAKVLQLKADPRTRVLMEYIGKEMFNNLWRVSPDISSMRQFMANITASFAYSCEAVVSHSEIIEDIRAEKFDVGIAEPTNLCGFGLFDHLEIPSTIGALSCMQLDLISYYIGEPLAPSYVPSLSSSFGEKMTFFGRMKNLMETIVPSMFLFNRFSAEALVLNEKLGKDYSYFNELFAQTSFIFTNSNPYLNYPRPLLHKTIEIGGISVDYEKIKELDEKWERILSKRRRSVLISFGSIAKSKDMPSEWKISILKLCESMPEVTFIWKYEENLETDLQNLHLEPWLPQKALLADLRLSLFITHGGLGSTTEAAFLGKPVIMIPLFGDQARNAEMLARHGGGIVLKKTDLSSPDVLKTSVQTILDDEKYSKAADRLSNLLQNQPISPRKLVVSHAEFAAKFGPFPQLDPFGRQLNILQYYFIDAIFFVSLFGIIFVFLISLIFRRLLNAIFGVNKEKTQ